MVSNIYLNKICSNLKNYQGTFSCNQIKNLKINLTNNTYIVNLSKSTEKGSHLIAIQVNNKDKIIRYFDSFGLPCTNQDILLFLSRVNKKYFYNNKQIQHFKSEYCGMYCLAFVMYHDNSSNFNKFLKMFQSDNLFKNDKIVIRYISQNTNLFSQKLT